MNLCRDCGRDFGSLKAFDAHFQINNDYTLRQGLDMDPPRYDGFRCLDEEELTEKGIVKNVRGVYAFAKNIEKWKNSPLNPSRDKLSDPSP